MKKISYEDINIVYEDNHILVVVKPQNVPSQPDSSGDPDMLTILKEYLVKKYDKPGEAYLGLVHRLDRPTGGVMIFAKTSKAAMRLSEQIKNNIFEKKYLAIVRDIPEIRKNILVNYLGKDERNNVVSVVPMATPGAKKAELEYKVLENKKTVALLTIALKTGRSHQIRVQLANIGHPIFGDLKYGAKKNADIVGKNLRLSLWAYELKVKHPTTKEQLVFTVFPPTEDIPWSLFDISKHLNIVAPKDF